MLPFRPKGVPNPNDRLNVQPAQANVPTGHSPRQRPCHPERRRGIWPRMSHHPRQTGSFSPAKPDRNIAPLDKAIPRSRPDISTAPRLTGAALDMTEGRARLGHLQTCGAPHHHAPPDEDKPYDAKGLGTAPENGKEKSLRSAEKTIIELLRSLRLRCLVRTEDAEPRFVSVQ